jgi:hypothetical protein
MRLFGSWKEVGFDGFVDFNDGLNEDLLDVFDFVIKSFHEMSHNLSENVGYGLVIQLSISNHIEMPYEPSSDLGSSSARGTECCQKDDVLDFHKLLILSVVPPVMIQELSQKFNRRLCTVLLFFRHV